MRRANLRRALLQRWQERPGKQFRAQLLTALYENKCPPQAGLAAPTEGRDAQPALDLRFIDLSDLILDDVDLTGASLQGAFLAGTSLNGAKLVAARLRGAFLSDTQLSHADLRGADLRDAFLENVNFDEADLTGVRINRGTRLAGTTKLPPTVMRRRRSLSFA
jgi:uncharacterized protein YjbI with pentapeptide repeats